MSSSRAELSIAPGSLTVKTGSSNAVEGEREYTIRLQPLMEPLLRYFARRVQPIDDGYDCLSETLLVLWRRRAAAPVSADEFRAWAYGIAKRVLANHIRAVRRRDRLGAKAREEGALIVQQAENESDDARAALAKLAPRDRELVQLIVWDELGVAEAGRLVGLKPEAARTRYSRARKFLRQTLSK